MKVLVTGSSGRLGKEIIKYLRAREIAYIGIDLVPAETTDAVVDIRDRAKLDNLFSQVDHVIHTAALHGKHTDLNLPREDFIQVNILGTLNLLNLSVKHSIKKFVYTSTTSIYGKAMVHPEQAVWVEESLTPIPRDIYDITKQATENLCQDFFEKEGLATCVLRVSRFMDEPINNIVNYRLYRGLAETDGALAHYRALITPLDTFEIFNVSNKSPFTKGDLAKLKTNPVSVILNYFPRADEVYKARGWNFPTSIDRVYDITKAERILGYQPQQNFTEIINV